MNFTRWPWSSNQRWIIQQVKTGIGPCWWHSHQCHNAISNVTQAFDWYCNNLILWVCKCKNRKWYMVFKIWGVPKKPHHPVVSNNYLSFYPIMAQTKSLIKLIKVQLTWWKRWALYVGFISFSQVVLVSWRIYSGSIHNIMLYETNKYSGPFSPSKLHFNLRAFQFVYGHFSWYCQSYTSRIFSYVTEAPKRGVISDILENYIQLNWLMILKIYQFQTTYSYAVEIISPNNPYF